MSRAISRILLTIAFLSSYSCGRSPSVMVTPEVSASNIKSDEAIKNKIPEIKPKSIIPVAKIVPESKSFSGNTYKDNYSWLKNKNNPEVKKYLQEEADYSKIVLKPTEELQNSLYKEIFNRDKVNDTTYPQKIGNNYYYFKRDTNYPNPVYCRKRNNLQSREEVLVDLNNLFRVNQDLLKIGDFKVSPDQKYLAYAIDTNNSGKFNIYLQNLSNNELVGEVITNTSGNIEWTNDNKNLYYITIDDEFRPNKVYKHNITTKISSDYLAYYEKDKSFKLDISKTDSNAFLLIKAKSPDASEIQYLGAKETKGKFKVFQKRKDGIIYDLEHNGGKFLVLTNSNAKNYKLMSANILEQYRNNSWQELIAEIPDQKLKSMQVYKDNVVVLFEENGKSKIKLFNLRKNRTEDLDLKEINYSINLIDNNDFNSNSIRFSYSSLLSPPSVFEYNIASKKLNVIKKTDINSYNPYDYQTEKVLVRLPEGRNVPIALLYKKGTVKNGNSALLLEASNNYSFSSERISLLERGVIIALADIGDTEQNLLSKNLDYNLINCAEYLINNNYTSPGKMSVYGKGKSALVLAQAINKRPELFNTVLLDSPMLDLVNQPGDLKSNTSNYFDILLSNSPYDNIRVEKYPNILINTKSDDKLYEALKYVAKLRAIKKDNNKLVLGSADNFINSILKENSLKYAFILDSLGLKN